MRPLIPSVLVLLTATLVGCAKESNGLAPGAGAAGSLAAASTAATAPPKGPFRRGQQTAKTLLTHEGPKIEVLSPARGSITSSPGATIRVRATDPDGVASLQIQGTPANPSGVDEWDASVPLSPGPNLIEVVAVDKKGDRGSARFQLVRGETLPAGDPVPGAVAGNLSASGLTFVSTQAASFARSFDLLPLLKAKDPIWEGYGAKASVVSLQHQPIGLALEGEPRGLAVRATLDAVVVGLDVKFLGAGLGAVSIAADRITLSGVAVLDTSRPAAGGSKLNVPLRDVQVTFDNFGVKASSSLVGTILGWARGPIERAVQTAIEDSIGQELSAKLGSLKVPGVDAPIMVPVNIPGLGPTPMDLVVRPDRAAGDSARGLDLEAALSVRPSSSSTTWPTGVYASGIRAPAGNVGASVTVGLSQDGANAFFDALGRTGALRYVLDGSKGGTPIPLSAKLLYPFFKPVQELAPDRETPVVVRVEAMTAPVILFEKGRIKVAAGELELSIALDYMDGGAPLELMAVRLTLEAEATLAIVGGRALKVSDLKLTRCASDVVREPAASFADDELEKFLDAMGPKFLDSYKDSLPEIPIPALPAGIVLKKADMAVHAGFILVWGDV